MCNAVYIDSKDSKIVKNNLQIDLTTTEISILRYLSTNSHSAKCIDDILLHCWRQKVVTSGSVTVAISSLRKKAKQLTKIENHFIFTEKEQSGKTCYRLCTGVSFDKIDSSSKKPTKKTPTSLKAALLVATILTTLLTTYNFTNQLKSTDLTALTQSSR